MKPEIQGFFDPLHPLSAMSFTRRTAASAPSSIQSLITIRRPAAPATTAADKVIAVVREHGLNVSWLLKPTPTPTTCRPRPTCRRSWGTSSALAGICGVQHAFSRDLQPQGREGRRLAVGHLFEADEEFMIGNPERAQCTCRAIRRPTWLTR